MSAYLDSPVTAAVPAQPDAALGAVTDVWHAVDGVRVAIDFPAVDPPTLAVGRTGEVRFERVGAPGFTALGKVAYRRDEDGWRTYHVLFGDRARAVLWSLLRPGRATRVTPDADEPIEVLLTVPDAPEAVAVSARDLSLTGVGVEVPFEHEPALLGVEALEVRLDLPGDDEPLALLARITSRTLGRTGISYGLEFTEDALPEADSRRAALEAFVSSRAAESDPDARRRSA